MSALKVKVKINCNTCGCDLARTKTIKVSATTQEEAKLEADLKIKEWTRGLDGENCKICTSILKDVAA